MLTPEQRAHLRASTCPHCQRPLGVYHAYPIQPATLLSRLTESSPLHLDCANTTRPLLRGSGSVSMIYVVKSSSPTAPSAKLFETQPEDHHLHLYTPHAIHFHVGNRPATYEEIYHEMEPVIQQALELADDDKEIDSIRQQITWLQRFLPPIPASFKSQLNAPQP